ncbi:MAG TPA: ABC transporter substrate-binding protein [Candidatus Binatia bacterium]|nr:ABC transporter substrate-binding protein [Candidatus Binatia bacterium]
MTTLRTLVIAVATLALATPGGAGEPVTFAYSQLGYIGHLPWTVAIGQKYFEEQGLEVKGYNFESGGKSVAAVLGGSADFSANALEHAIKAKAQGKDLVYVFSSTRAPAWGLAVSSAHRNEIRSVADLKGKTVGVSGIGVASHVLLNYMLVKAGVDPRDVKIVAVGISTLPPALEGGKIVAGMAAEPFFSRMVKKGTAFSLGNMNTLKDTAAILGGEYAFSGAITRPDVIEKRPHQVQKVVTALVKAAHFIHTRTPDQVAAAIPAEYAGDRAQLAETIAGVKEAFTPAGMVTTPGVDTLMRVLMAFPDVFKPGQKVDVASTYDMRFVQQAIKDLKITTP